MFVSAPRITHTHTHGQKHTAPAKWDACRKKSYIHSTSRTLYFMCVCRMCRDGHSTGSTHTCTHTHTGAREKRPTKNNDRSLANSIIIVIDSVKLYLFHSMHSAYGRRNALETARTKSPKEKCFDSIRAIGQTKCTHTTEQMTRICLPIIKANNKFIENGISGPAISCRVCLFDFRLEIVVLHFLPIHGTVLALYGHCRIMALGFMLIRILMAMQASIRGVDGSESILRRFA